MAPETALKLSFFPGCSLATSARESLESLYRVCRTLGLELIELEDWNCCGSSSAHSLDQDLALNLAARNLSLAPPGRPLMTACPSCLKNLHSAHLHLAADAKRQSALQRRWGRPLDSDLQIVSFLEIMHFLQIMEKMRPQADLTKPPGLNGLKVAPYYGCMLARPKRLRRSFQVRDLMETAIGSLGGEALTWEHRDRCCGTFLAAARPDVTTPLVNRIMEGALLVEADCLVTACAMCQLNLEIRSTIKNPLPTLHFTEVLALALGAKCEDSWFSRHLVDPRPLLSRRGLF
jgi:heterodisulfide reductase subunit B